MITEKAKYDKMHGIPGYSPGPGISHVSTALKYMSGSSVIDFGCGTGDAAAAFQKEGYRVTGVDISSKGLRHDIDFVEASLADLPDVLIPAEWGFCCDVMEHLPPEWIEAALREIAGKVQNCFFSISGVPDSWGKKIGETLHLTVMPCSWWVEQIKKAFEDVQLVANTGSIFIVVAKHD